MTNLLDNCTYNTFKILHELSSLAWFIDNHALKDAREAGDAECALRLQALSQDIKRQINMFHQ